MNRAPIHVPLLDLRAQYAQIKSEVDEVVRRVVESQYFINGPEVGQLEKEIAAYCQAKHCIGVSSGTDALLMSLMALDVGPGDEIVSTPYTFFATAGSIARLGAKPVFVDIDPVTYNIDPNLLEAAITPRTKAIMPVHLYGQCAEMDPILEIAERHNLPVIEDAAQSIGAEYQGRRAGSMGTFGCYSFFPSKNLGAFGDGGAIVTNDDALAEKLFLLRNHGSQIKYHHKFVGGNFRLDTLQAAVLLVKLKYLDSWSEKRQHNASFYTEALAELNRHGLVVTPAIRQSRHIFNQYVIRVNDRDGLKEYFKKQNVGTETYYPVPMHLQECFENLGYRKGDFPFSEEAALHTLALPIYPELSEQQLDHVAGCINHFVEARRSPAVRAA